MPMKVGSLTETITVTAETPIGRDSVKRQMTLSSELLISAPTARSWAATAVLIPAIVAGRQCGGYPGDSA